MKDEEDEDEGGQMFASVIARFPVPSPFEEDWTLVASQNALINHSDVLSSSVADPLSGSWRAALKGSGSSSSTQRGAGRGRGSAAEAHHSSKSSSSSSQKVPESLTRQFTESEILAGRQGLAAQWRELRRHPVYQEAWEQAYAGDGEYALRILFLWPHNGTVMPIVSPEWALYARAAEQERQEREERKRRRRRPSPRGRVHKINSSNDGSSAGWTRGGGPVPGQQGEEEGRGGKNESENEVLRSPHLYISAGGFIKNSVLAWKMVDQLFSGIRD